MARRLTCIARNYPLVSPFSLHPSTRFVAQLELKKTTTTHRYFSSSCLTRLPVGDTPKNQVKEIMSNNHVDDHVVDKKTASNCPATLSKFLECNYHFASTCDPKILESCSKGQAPSLFWLGCSDSRVPEGVVIKAQPGEVFVHRNVANMFNPEDTSALAALAYAVNYLKVTHVVVVGHESCGGCQAALSAATSPENNEEKASTTTTSVDLGEAAIAKWIQPIKNLASEEIKKNSTTKDKETSFNLSQLVRLNVQSQVLNIVNHQIIQKAWQRGQNLSVHGWLYDLSSGKLIDLGFNYFKP